jgi:hypothetical protein
VDGVIVARQGEAGQAAEQYGDRLFQIAADIAALEVAIQPPASLLQKLRPGQNALVTIPDLQIPAMPGQVQEIRDKEAVVAFNSTSPAVKPGMRAEARF